MMGSESEQPPVTNAKGGAVTKTKRPKRDLSKKPRAAKQAASKLPPAASTNPGSKVPAKPAPKRKAARKQTSKADRASILAAADRKGLTAMQVQKRFGVKAVTYYSWRRASKKQSGPVRIGGSGILAGNDLARQVRETLRSEIARILPGMIQEELAAMFEGSAGGGSRKRK